MLLTIMIVKVIQVINMVNNNIMIILMPMIVIMMGMLILVQKNCYIKSVVLKLFARKRYLFL